MTGRSLLVILVACGTPQAPGSSPPAPRGQDAAPVASDAPPSVDAAVVDAAVAVAPDAWMPAKGDPVMTASPVGAAPPPPALPRAGAKGCYDPPAVFAAEKAYADYLAVMTARALASRGWSALPQATESGTLLVAPQRDSCGPPGVYAIDGAANVFAYAAYTKCARIVKLKVCGRWPAPGCGAAPPKRDWYVTAPASARVLATTASLEVEMARCIQIMPTDGFAYPP